MMSGKWRRTVGGLILAGILQSFLFGCAETEAGIIWAYQPHQGAGSPAFLAFQDGDGEWQHLDPEGVGSVVLPVEDPQGRYAVAQVCADNEAEFTWIATDALTTPLLVTACPEVGDADWLGIRIEGTADAMSVGAFWGGRSQVEDYDESDKGLPASLDLGFRTWPGTHDLVVTRDPDGSNSPDRFYRLPRLSAPAEVTVDLDADGFIPVPVPVSFERSGGASVHLLDDTGTDTHLGSTSVSDDQGIHLPPAEMMRATDRWYWSAQDYGTRARLQRIEPYGGALPAEVALDVEPRTLDVELGGFGDPWPEAMEISWFTAGQADLYTAELATWLGQGAGFVAVSGTRLAADDSWSAPDLSALEGWDDSWGIDHEEPSEVQLTARAHWLEEGDLTNMFRWVTQPRYARPYVSKYELAYDPAFLGDETLQWGDAIFYEQFEH